MHQVDKLSGLVTEPKEHEMLSKDRLIQVALTLLAIMPVSLFAQSNFDCEQDPQSCLDFEVRYELFCRSGVDASFRLGIDPDTFDISLTAEFAADQKKKKLDLYFSDGDIAPGRSKQVKVTQLLCSARNCSANVTAEFIDEIGQTFDLEQTFINASLRSGLRDECIGKFANNDEIVEEQSNLDRYFCSFTALTDTAIEGEGFYDPAGLSEGGKFHFRFAGAEEGSNINACQQIAGGKYRSIFSAPAVRASETDRDVYGNLSTREASLLSQSPDLYSYEFAREIASESRALSKSLSVVFNKSFSSDTASSQLKNATKERRDRKRKKRGETNRSLRSFERQMILESVRKRRSYQAVDEWLSFDPTFGVLLVAPNCKGDVYSKAIGTIACSVSASDKSCISLSGDSSSIRGSVCKEARDGYNLLTVRVQGADAGSYSLCFAGNLDANQLLVSSNSESTFGEIELVDVEAVATAVERFSHTATDISGVGLVGISADENCSNLILSGNFEG